MAMIRKTISQLSVEITEDNDRVIEATIRFNDGTDDYIINVPRLIQRRLDRLIREFRKSIAFDVDDVVRDTVVDKDYTIRLQPNG